MSRAFEGGDKRIKKSNRGTKSGGDGMENWGRQENSPGCHIGWKPLKKNEKSCIKKILRKS